MKREKRKITLYTIQDTYSEESFFAGEGIKAGFPSPATDYLQESIDLNKVIAPNPGNTFVVVAERGMCHIDCIDDGNLLVIEQALPPRQTDWVAYLEDGEFLIGRKSELDKKGQILLGVLIANIRIYKEHFFRNIESIPILSDENGHLPSFVRERVMGKIDLKQILIKNPPTTFVTIADGDSMIEECINDTDILIIDKSIDPYDQCLAACYLNGEFTLKKVKVENDNAWLLPSNPDYPVIEISLDDNFIVWGILTSNIRQFRYGRGHGRTG